MPRDPESFDGEKPDREMLIGRLLEWLQNPVDMRKEMVLYTAEAENDHKNSLWNNLLATGSCVDWKMPSKNVLQRMSYIGLLCT